MYVCGIDNTEIAKSYANGRVILAHLLLNQGAGTYALTMERITVDIGKDWLSVADICDYMDVSAFVVTSQLRAGVLPAVKFGREWRVARQDFEDWINDQRGADAEQTEEHSST